MIKIVDKSLCTGCTACANACGHHAIKMTFDVEGHYYPEIDATACVDCGLCNKVCPMLHQYRLPNDDNLDKLAVFAVYNKENEVRSRSTSGGVFTILANYVLDKGGVVYAARFDKNYHIYHTSVESKEDLQAFRGSKYAQSDLSDVFLQVKAMLKTGRHVLFVGTPCQVGGIKSYLRKDYNNLLTCDFICMGISSPKIWEEYLAEYWDPQKIKRIVFKDKRNGWHGWRMLIEDNEGEHLCKGIENPFFSSYLLHITYRPSCFTCPFRRVRRVSDITIADCWGIDKVNPSFDDDKGCTTLILQSNKGENIFNEIKISLNIASYSVGAVLEHNPYIRKPISCPSTRRKFYRKYRKRGISIALEKYKYSVKSSLIGRIINKLKNIIAR
jgi:coenzyme F420-reducing hydrogenase beta subunit